MPKTLVVGCDGTWNDRLSQTNIHWLTEAALADSRQLVFYDAGVGTAGEWDAKIGGNFGLGLSANVRQAYAFLRDAWEPGDAIFLLGFSRGAFTVRSLAGFMRLVGRLRDPALIDEAYIYYRVHEPDEDDSFFERMLRPETGPPMPVRFLGVFDTVGALGLPFEIRDQAPDIRDTVWARAGQLVIRWIDELGDRVRRPIKGFHDTRLGNQVQEAVQALAIDEPRGLFAPALWTETAGEALKVDAAGDPHRVAQQVEQLWFAGSHMDVGGGDTLTPQEQRLSNLPLLWMAERAAAAGLRFRDGFLDELRAQAAAATTGPQNDPWTARWERLHRQTHMEAGPRPIGNAARRDTARPDLWPPVAAPEAIHASVGRRLGRQVLVIPREGEPRTHAYAPANVVPSMIQSD